MGDEPGSKKALSVLGRSMRSPLNLAALASGAGASALFHLWPLGALGGLAYAALVAHDLVSAEFWKRSLDTEAKEAQDAEEERKNEERKRRKASPIMDSTLRQLSTQIDRARAELNAVVASNSGVAAQIGSVLAAATTLDERAAAVIKSGDQLAAFLLRTDPDAIKKEIHGLRARATRVTDDATREQYLRTIATREEQLKAVLDIAAALERAQANLMRIIATYEGISARVVRMSAIEGADMSHVFGDMNAELEDVNRDLESYEEVIRQLQPTGALS